MFDTAVVSWGFKEGFASIPRGSASQVKDRRADREFASSIDEHPTFCLVLLYILIIIILAILLVKNVTVPTAVSRTAPVGRSAPECCPVLE